MNELTEQAEPSGSRRPRKEVFCAKCGESNPRTQNSCTHCGSRLFISCHSCGHSNERSATRCEHCGRRLHRRWWKRFQKTLFGERPKITAWQIVLLVVAIYAGYRVVVYLSEYQSPPPQGVQLRTPNRQFDIERV